MNEPAELGPLMAPDRDRAIAVLNNVRLRWTAPRADFEEYSPAPYRWPGRPATMLLVGSLNQVVRDFLSVPHFLDHLPPFSAGTTAAFTRDPESKPAGRSQLT
jgi:hypothetical protein